MGPEAKLYKKLKTETTDIIWNRIENLSLLGMPDCLGYNSSSHFFTVELKENQHKENWKKRAQEAEGEMSILKGIETNRVKEAQAKSNQLQNEVDRFKKDNNDLYNRIADALEVNESHQKSNGKLQERLTELEQENIEMHAENKKIHNHLQERIDNARKSGM